MLSIMAGRQRLVGRVIIDKVSRFVGWWIHDIWITISNGEVINNQGFILWITSCGALLGLPWPASACAACPSWAVLTSRYAVCRVSFLRCVTPPRNQINNNKNWRHLKNWAWASLYAAPSKSWVLSNPCLYKKKWYPTCWVTATTLLPWRRQEREKLQPTAFPYCKR